MKILGVIDTSFSLDVAGRYAFKPLIGRMLSCLSCEQTKGSIRGPDLIFLNLNRGPIQSFSRIIHRHYSCIISLGLSLINLGFGYQSIGTGGREISSFNIYHKSLMGSNTLLLKRMEINKLFSEEKMLKLLSTSSKIIPEPKYTTTMKETSDSPLEEKNVINISNHKVHEDNNIGLNMKETDKMIYERVSPYLDIFTGRQTRDRLIENTIQKIDTLLSMRNGIFSGGHSAIGMRPLSYQKYNLQEVHEDMSSYLPGIFGMRTIPKGADMAFAKEDHPYSMPSSGEGHLIYPTFRNGPDTVQNIKAIEKESIEDKAECLPSRFQAAPTFDVNRLTDQIYSLIQRRIKLERERRGM